MKRGMGDPAWSCRRDSNPRPADYKSAALPTELRQRVCPVRRGDDAQGFSSFRDVKRRIVATAWRGWCRSCHYGLPCAYWPVITQPCSSSAHVCGFALQPLLVRFRLSMNLLVEISGLEPLASCLQGRRSPS